MSFPGDHPSSALTLSARSYKFLSDQQLHPKTARMGFGKTKATALRVPGGHFEGCGLSSNYRLRLALLDGDRGLVAPHPPAHPDVARKPKVSARKAKMTRKGGWADASISVAPGTEERKDEGKRQDTTTPAIDEPI